MKEMSSVRKVVISSTFATGLVLASPQLVDAALGDQTLRVGTNHADVIELQNALADKGFFNYDRSTGYFGTITEEAVREFQRKNNLQIDGIAGPQTISTLLNQMGQQTSTSSNTTSVSQANRTVSSGLLRLGSRGSQVEQLQQKLKELGLYDHSITGTFGSITERAVRDYQRKNQLQVDGIAGQQTLTRLFNESAPVETSNPAPNNKEEREVLTAGVTTSSTLRLGQSGSPVTELQAQLRSVGVFDRSPTGYFGQETLTAVRNFQRVHRLTSDGIAGPKTLSKLNEVATNAPARSTSTTSSNTTVSRSGSGNAAFVTNLVAEAATHIGIPYLWGGTTTRGFDCSGYLQYVFNQQGISLPRTVAQQWNVGKTVSQPAVGDVVFFETYTSGPSHNGIYIGNNQFVHSGSSSGVTITSMNNSY